MGTAERHETSDDGAVAHRVAQRRPEAPDRDIPGDGHRSAGRRGVPAGVSAGPAAHEGAARAGAPDVPNSPGSARDSTQYLIQDGAQYRTLWVEEPARRRRMPDPVRTAAVRAVIIIAVTLIQAMVAFLCTMAGSWLAFPMVLSSVTSTVVATWAVLDVWVTRQVWNQRNGVVSAPSSTARSLRRERRRARRQARATERANKRIRRAGGTGRLSHP
ncbi:hypothetical protein [Streptomyces sp. NPDC001315]|uniref:hypothetical protein n=1 Tax=Streptomyces sp. NPDC001315 TaxID=3364562 RepID=UPI0036B3E205